MVEEQELTHQPAPPDPAETPAAQDWSGLEPGDPSFAGSPSPEISRLAGAMEEDWQAQQRLKQEFDRDGETSIDEDRIMRYAIDWLRLAVYGAFGVALWAASVLVPRWNTALGDPLGDWEDYLRLLLMLGGAVLIFAGWPRYIRRDQTLPQADAEDQQRFEAKEAFRRKIRR
jgi:hypothetical protein